MRDYLHRLGFIASFGFIAEGVGNGGSNQPFATWGSMILAAYLYGRIFPERD